MVAAVRIKNRVTAFAGRVSSVLLALLLSLSPGCSAATSSNVDPNTEVEAKEKGVEVAEHQESTSATNIDPRLVNAANRFAFKLYNELTKNSGNRDLFVSPSSVALCLAMVYNGSDGETRKAMASALEFGNLSMEETNKGFAELMKLLESPDPKVQLKIANSLWARQNFPFKPDFIERNKTNFRAEVTTLDFGSPSAPSTINSWVKDKTSGKIEKIVEQIDPAAVLFLVNAIYFKGSWTSKFKPELTKDAPFNRTVGGQSRVKMMSSTGKYRYLETEKLQAIGLPYGGNGRVSMYVVLPKSNSSLAELHRELKADSWENWMSSFKRLDGEIQLPRFKLEFEETLNDALKAIGMAVAFDDGRADFSAMTSSRERAYLSKVKHKTFVEVNEEGTEAAAVTSAEIQVTSAIQQREPFKMVVDRPFFVAIRDNLTGALLFMGSINDPQ